MHLLAFILSTIVVGTSCLTSFGGGSVDFQLNWNGGSENLASALSALQSAKTELGKLESQAQLIKTSTTEGTAEYQQGMTQVVDGLVKLKDKLVSEVQGNLTKFVSQSPNINVLGKLIAQKLKDSLATVSQSIQSSLEKLFNPDNVNALSSALKTAVGQVTEKLKSTLAPLTDNLSKLQDVLKGSSASVPAALSELLKKVSTAVAGIQDKLNSIDAGLPSSGGVGTDLGLPSSGGVDTGLPSSGGVDTGLPSSGGVDTGLPSSGGVDTGLPSSGNVYPDVPAASGTAEACASGSGASAGASVPESG